MGMISLLFKGLILIVVFGGGFLIGQSVLLSPALSPEEGVALAPPNHIDTDKIIATDGGVLILVNDAKIVNYDSTDSMVPVLDEGANGIVVEVDCDLIEVGDIVSYRNDDLDIIPHRVVSLLSEGFIVKGDNSPTVEEISCGDVVGVLVGVVY